MRCKHYASILLLLAMPAAAQEIRPSELCADGRWHQQGDCPAVLSSPAYSLVTDTSVTVGYQVDRSSVATYVCCAAAPPSNPEDIAACAAGFRGEDEVDVAGSRSATVRGLLPETEYSCAVVSYLPVQDRVPGGEEEDEAEFVYDPVGWASNVIQTASFETQEADGGGDGGDSGTVIFAETFDDEDEGKWLSGRCLNLQDSDCATVVNLENWEFLYTDNPSGDPQGRVLTAAGRTGKGLRFWDEADHKGSSQWGAESQPGKYFEGQQFSEMWISWWIRLAQDYPDTYNRKFLHAFHYDPDWPEGAAGSFYKTGDSTDGGVICNIRNYTGDLWEFRCSLRCANPPNYSCNASRSGTTIANPSGAAWDGRPQRFQLQSNSACTGVTSPTFASVFGNGWNHVEVGLRYNSAKGVADGELEFWYNGCRLGYVTNIAWAESGATDNPTGFNGVTIGGNAVNNTWAPLGTESHVYDVDDFRICSGGRCP